MLEFFRQHVAGFFGIVIVGVLALAFALSFGAQSAGWGKAQSERFAATVEGVDIPETTMQYAFNLSGGNTTDQTDVQRSAFKLSVLSGLIERQLLLNMAQQLQITASKEEAEDRIIDNKIYLTRPLKDLTDQVASSYFIDPSLISRILVSDGHRVRQSFTNAAGKFDLETYQKFVRYYLQMTESDFVEQQRLELIAERMRQLMVNAVRVSPEEVRSTYEREHDTAEIAYIRLIPSYFSDGLAPTSTELTEWASTHPDEVKQYYETNKFRYTNVERMARARHILIKVAEDATDADKAAARVKIDNLLARARKGENFAALAKAHSQDEGSAVKGGDLGFTPRGRMVPAFDDAMFAATPGKITDVVTTKFGYHIIKVEAFREGNVSLEEATPEIAEKLYRETRGKELAESTAEAFLTRLKNGEAMADLIPKPDDDKASHHLGLKMLTSRPFSKSATSIPGIGEAPEMATAAFALSDEHPVPDKVFELRNTYYVIRLEEKNQPNDEEFEKLKASLENKLTAMKQGAWLRDQVDVLKRRVENEGQLAIHYTSPSAAAPPMPASPERPSEPETAAQQDAPDPTAANDQPPSAKAPKPADPAPEPEDAAEDKDEEE
ncbi:MAG: peptidylprolyl isomerase [Myxococcota bacterium]|nr:peptidylprolyl isomerase [Myxococcota bacterium]